MPDTRETSVTRATWMQHASDTSDTNVAKVRHKKHECDTSATRAITFDFDNDTSKDIFSHPYIYYMASERLQGEE